MAHYDTQRRLAFVSFRRSQYFMLYYGHKMARRKPTKKDDREEIGVVGPKTAESKEQTESTRRSIAIFFVQGFVLTVAGVILIGTFRDYTVNENKDMLLAVSGILSGPLGFIIGYYFKSKDE